jgi:GNAT superfamily N-acetyltransferase
MKTEVTIRAAVPEDAELLAQLGRETFYEAFAHFPQMPPKDLGRYVDEAFTVTGLTGQLADERSIFLVAEIDREAVGYAKLEIDRAIPRVTAANPVKLKRLYCKQSFVGDGVGAALIERCLEKSDERKQDVIWLTVWEHNLRAQRFYRKWEFKPCGAIEFLLGETVLQDVIMQRPVIINNIYKKTELRSSVVLS